MRTSKYRKRDSHSPEEFERLYRECFNSVYSYILFRMVDAEIARDVTADAFLRAARYFENFDSSRAKFSTWVIAIARNCMTDHYRKVKPYVPIENVAESALGTQEDHADQTINADLVKRLLSFLDDDERELIRLKFIEDMSNKAIAEEIGMNPSTVATKVQRALAKMRNAAEVKKH